MFRDIYKHYFSVLHFKIGPLLFKIEGVTGFVLQSCPEQKQKKFCSPPDYRLSIVTEAKYGRRQNTDGADVFFTLNS